MIENLLSTIGEYYPLKELDAGEFARIKVNGMNFHIRHFTLEGVGKLSFMDAKGFFGLMRMQSIIINPFVIDAPLMSYDRVLAFGKDTLILETYNTMLENSFDPYKLIRVKESAKEYKDHEAGEQWYDDLRIPGALIQKEGKKKEYRVFNRIGEQFVVAFLESCKMTSPCEEKSKKEKAAVYSEGLLSHGGPATDIFLKNVGLEKTQQLFRSVLFGC